MADHTWTAPVLDELSIPAGTYGGDDQGDLGQGNPDQGTSIS